LLVKDVNPLHQSISVNKAFSTDESGKVVITTTKTNQQRVVPIPNKLNPIILGLIKDRKPDDLIFTGIKGGILNYGWFMKHIYLPAVSRAGVEGIGFHNLRHTCASLLIANGTPITTVSGILGHASTKMTLDLYGHFYKEDSADWINQVTNSFSEVDRYKIGTTQQIAIS
jgi:integrase